MGVFTKHFGLIKCFSTSQIIFKEQLKNAKSFKPSSQNWLLRQLNDTWVKKAKVEHYRCRSAFKLLEIQEKYKLMRPGHVVIDLGCAPGSWTQVAVKATQSTLPGSGSMVIGVDLSPVHAIEGATILSRQDVTSDATQQLLKETLGGRAVNVVISDMAPSATGIRSLDHDNIVQLCYTALTFARKTSSPGASLVMKLFDGGDTKRLMADCKAVYETVKHVRPEASRKESSELFLVCRNFKGENVSTEPELIGVSTNKSSVNGNS